MGAVAVCGAPAGRLGRRAAGRQLEPVPKLGQGRRPTVPSAVRSLGRSSGMLVFLPRLGAPRVFRFCQHRRRPPLCPCKGRRRPPLLLDSVPDKGQQRMLPAQEHRRLPTHRMTLVPMTPSAGILHTPHYDTSFPSSRRFSLTQDSGAPVFGRMTRSLGVRNEYAQGSTFCSSPSLHVLLSCFKG